jgi:hypothetical protein
MFDCYLAIPYTDTDREVMQMRHDAVTEIYDALTLRGLAVHSPITTNHRLADRMGHDWSAWEAIDRKTLAACRVLVVYCAPGWHKSIGIAHEVELAQQLGKQIVMLPYGVGIDNAIDILASELKRSESDE